MFFLWLSSYILDPWRWSIENTAHITSDDRLNTCFFCWVVRFPWFDFISSPWVGYIACCLATCGSSSARILTSISGDISRGDGGKLMSAESMFREVRRIKVSSSWDCQAVENVNWSSKSRNKIVKLTFLQLPCLVCGLISLQTCGGNSGSSAALGSFAVLFVFVACLLEKIIEESL